MYLYKEMKEDIKQPGIVSRVNQPAVCSRLALHDVRIRYKPGRQAVPVILSPSKYSDRTGFRPVIQRSIMVANHDLSNFQDAYIYRRCVQNSLGRIAARDYSLELGDEDFLQWIGKMKSADELFRVKSYVELNHKLCLFILSNMPQRVVTQPPSGFSFSSFSAGDMKQALPDLKPEDLYRPGSPVVTRDDDLRRMRTERSVGFRIADRENAYHVGGAGRFMSGVGTYRDLLSDGDVLVPELNALFSGAQMFSQYKAANDLYALIIGVEGCARSAHNIALARIFFENYSTIKENHPDKSLYELAEMFLTFVQNGGASLSQHYVENLNELQMLFAHCKANNVPFTAEHISSYLTMVIEDTIKQSRIKTTYPLYCEETFAIIAGALRQSSLLSDATDKEIQEFIEEYAENAKSEQHTLYDWETISGIWYLEYYLKVSNS